MFKHQWFDLYLHTDEELGEILKTSITIRETLHEWPLSCVQRLITEDDYQWIYKTQTGPTVESQFYAEAKSGLLVTAQTLYEQAGHTIMLFEYVDAPLVDNLTLTSDEIVQMGRDIQEHMAMIKGDLPVLFDISDAKKWRKMVQWTLDNLRSLLDNKALTEVTANALVALNKHALNSSVLDATSHRTEH